MFLPCKSDHFPIALEVNMPSATKTISRLNMSKANWFSFKSSSSVFLIIKVTQFLRLTYQKKPPAPGNYHYKGFDYVSEILFKLGMLLKVFNFGYVPKSLAFDQLLWDSYFPVIFQNYTN